MKGSSSGWKGGELLLGGENGRKGGSKLSPGPLSRLFPFTRTRPDSGGRIGEEVGWWGVRGVSQGKRRCKAVEPHQRNS